MTGVERGERGADGERAAERQVGGGGVRTVERVQGWSVERHLVDRVLGRSQHVAPQPCIGVRVYTRFLCLSRRARALRSPVLARRDARRRLLRKTLLAASASR